MNVTLSLSVDDGQDRAGLPVLERFSMSVDDLWFQKFCSLSANRKEMLGDALGFWGEIHEISTPPWTHWQTQRGLPENGELILVAHYDRHPGTPGANDNSASVRHLLDYLARQPMLVQQGRQPRRVVFTDGEEIFGKRSLQQQGACLLGQLWKSAGRQPFVIVLDMTGIGDTFVLGHLSESVRQKAEAVDENTKALRLWVRRLLSAAGAGDFVEIDTPFSDDLGFLWSGIPAVQISLLPKKQALVYRKQNMKRVAQDLASRLPLPAAWQTMHSLQDVPENLWPQSRPLMAQFLELASSIPFLFRG
ncbi:MAG: M28 family peptidase [Spirochaetales bacterium]|nr:M28 family peptidase [Spirochaetales bacterium]